MYLQAFLLFLTTLLSGLLVLRFPQKIAIHNHLFLTFGGSFLFSFTLIDILPSLYAFSGAHPMLVYYLLIGFFFQFFLDLLSQGIAHGHVHSLESKHSVSSLGLLGALCIHAMFDGLLVSVPEHLLLTQHEGSHYHSHGLLSGIIWHKIPATISFVAILVLRRHSIGTILVYLLLFSLASPLGCFLSNVLQSDDLTMQEPFIACWALAVGNLLHIATTTLSEANPDHRFSPTTLMANLVGAVLAVIAAIY